MDKMMMDEIEKQESMSSHDFSEEEEKGITMDDIEK